MSEQITTPTEEQNNPNVEEIQNASHSETPTENQANLDPENLAKTQSETEAKGDDAGEDKVLTTPTEEQNNPNVDPKESEGLGNESVQKTIDSLNATEQAALLSEIKSAMQSAHLDTVKGSLVVDSILRAVSNKLGLAEDENEQLDELQSAIVSSATEQKFLDLVSKIRSCLNNPSYQDNSRLSMIGESIDLYLGELG